jgi:hypothetical protein
MAQGKSFDTGKEFAGLDFHSSRLEGRFVRTMETLCKQPDKSIWEASKDRAETKAIYRMLGNGGIDREETLRAHREAVIGRMTGYGGPVLVGQDTTRDNTHLKTEGTGYISDKPLGVNIHSYPAVTRDGLVLGVLDQSGYNWKEPKDEPAGRGNRKARPIEEKENFRWRGLKSEETLERSAAGLPRA